LLGDGGGSGGGGAGGGGGGAGAGAGGGEDKHSEWQGQDAGGGRDDGHDNNSLPHLCPSCDSADKQVLLSQNYSLSQPRYFCSPVGAVGGTGLKVVPTVTSLLVLVAVRTNAPRWRLSRI
ncbi:hypothetical protein SOVF_082500, partial [Spinacia oleracea]